MRVGFSTSVIQRGRTGVAQHVFALLKGFQQISTPHRFVLFVLEQDLPLFDFVRGTMDLVPVPEHFRPPIRNILWHQQVLPGLVQRHALDLLHVPSYRRLLYSKPCPLVATIHDLAPFTVPKKYDPFRMFYGRVIVKRLARRQDAIIAISRNTARDIEKYFGIHPERLHVIHNGLDHGRFHPRPDEDQEILRKHALQSPFFLYVARLEHPGKNHVKLVEAFNLFKAKSRAGHQLVFAGSDWHGAEVIHETIRRSPFRSDIQVLGFVPDSDLPALYQSAHAFLYPSLYEGFGLPPLEAMACGCPAICSDRGALGEVVGDAALVIDPENAASISEALEELAKSEATRRRLADAGLARARLFSWEKAASETAALYERVAGFTSERREIDIESRSPHIQWR